ncbi:hypothetical protein CcI6DRAFT_02000 [Frankia sp. CcI6]|nr:hypothetical protein CcI6DRAFT_02000 [Frankia sp. CcI6]
MGPGREPARRRAGRAGYDGYLARNDRASGIGE